MIADYQAVWLVGLAGLLLSLVTFFIIQTQMAQQRRLEFEWAGQNRFRTLQKEIDNALAAIVELQALLQRLERIDTDGFNASASAILETYPTVEALIWAPRPHEGEGEHFPALHVAPPGEQPSLAGRDIRSMATAAAAMDQARDSGRLRVSGRLPDLWPADPGARFVAFYPLYRRGAPTGTETERRAGLLGFATGLLRARSLVEHSMTVLEPRGIDIFLQDADDPSGDLIHAYHSRLDPHGVNEQRIPADGRQRVEASLHVGGRIWRFTGVETPRFRSAQAFHEGPWLILAEGLLFTAVLTLYLYRLKQDVRVRLEMEASYRENNEQLEALLSHSPDVIVTLDQAGRILFINRYWPATVLRDEPVGALFADALPVPCRSRFAEAMQVALAGERVDHFLCPHPDLSWWEVRLIPVSGEGVRARAMVALRNVTENRILQAQAMRSARLASLGVLAASVAHEINNPNSAIRFNASVLQRAFHDLTPVIEAHGRDHPGAALAGLPIGESLETLPKLVSGITASAERIRKIVGNLKHMAQRDRGEPDQRLSIGEILQSATTILQNQIRKMTDHFQMTIDETLPTVQGNAQQLEQVFINVILNALQSLPDRSHGVAVSAELDETGDRLLVLVRDEGVGIPEERIQKIFEPFFTTREESGGTGLGLSISDRILKNHGGDMLLASRPGAGTLVTIRLPLHPSSLDRLTT